MKSALTSINTFFFSTPADAASFETTSHSTNSFSSKKLKKFFKNSPYLPFVVVFIVVLGIIVMVYRGMSKNAANVQGTQTNASTSQVAIAKPLAQETLNREFQFPIKDTTGKEVSQIKYEVQNVEQRNQIIIQGQTATAVAGRTFLILNLKITNTYDKSIQINARDYVRLSVNGSDEKLAPDIHNDPVDVQAISTKYTRLGFPINTTDKNLILQVGEISGKKESINLNLK